MPKKRMSLVYDDTCHFSHRFTVQNDSPIDDIYEVAGGTLGEGSYGQVSKGTHRDTGAVRAIKAISREVISSEGRFKEEVNIQASLDHCNIVKLHEVFTDAKKVYLVMELCTGGELFDRIVEETESHAGAGAFNEKGAATYMQQIMGAMTYLHSMNFVHRDIKPENFLMQDKSKEARIKVIDFGLAKAYKCGEDGGDGPKLRTKAGTPYYVSPQVLKGNYNEKCDIWSCGVIAYILLAGYPPFYGDTDGEILRRVKSGKFDFPSVDWGHVSADAKDLVTSMLSYEECDRPTAAQCLEHRWITGCAAAAAPPESIKKDLASSLKQFNQQGRMKKVALTLMAKQIKDEDLAELRNMFMALDENNDGTLTYDEILGGMKKIGVEGSMTEVDLKGLLASLDTDGSGKIDYTEFIAATLTKKQYLKRDILWSAFRVFDLDGDGVITRDELRTVMQDLEDDNKETSIMGQMIKEVDTDGDGNISFEEFVSMMGGAK